MPPGTERIEDEPSKYVNGSGQLHSAHCPVCKAEATELVWLRDTTLRCNTQTALDYLNSINAADPRALNCLLCNRVPANQALLDHPHVVVNAVRPGVETVGLLGIINGLLTSFGLDRVASQYGAPEEDGHCPFLGFVPVLARAGSATG